MTHDFMYAGDWEDGSGDLLPDDEENVYWKSPVRILDHGQTELFSVKLKGLTPCQEYR
jgi:hypothetical protein